MLRTRIVEIPPGDHGPLSPSAAVRRLLKRPALNPYVRLGGAVVLVNLVVFLLRLPSFTAVRADSAVRTASDLALVNLAVAIAIRQRHVVNLLFRIALSAPHRWSPTVRWTAAKIYHHGGVHVGAAISGTAWYVLHLAFSFVAAGISPVSRCLSIATAALLVLMVTTAVRPLRERFHDRFELVHRLGGWSVLALVVVQVVLSALGGRDLTGWAVLGSWQVWVAAAAVVSVVLPWTSLRRVPLTVTRLSGHAVSLTFPHRARFWPGSTTALSLSPLREWHSFANIDAESDGTCRIIMSRAGDWTGDFIDNPPAHAWIKGGPTAGMSAVEALFPRVLFVATGSGIGPVLACAIRRTLPFRVLWITRDPITTYGAALCDEVRRLDPDTVVWDTSRRGKPDVPALTREVLAEFAATAVVFVSNKSLTWQVVPELEKSRIPAFGAIWDS